MAGAAVIRGVVLDSCLPACFLLVVVVVFWCVFVAAFCLGFFVGLGGMLCFSRLIACVV